MTTAAKVVTRCVPTTLLRTTSEPSLTSRRLKSSSKRMVRVPAHSVTTQAILRGLFCLYSKWNSASLFFYRECRPTIARLKWTESPTLASSIRDESPSPLARKIFVKRAMRKGPKNSAESRSCIGVSQTNSVDVRTKTNGAQSQKKTIAFSMKTLHNAALNTSPAPDQRRTKGRETTTNTLKLQHGKYAIWNALVNKPCIGSSAAMQIINVNAKQCRQASTRH